MSHHKEKNVKSKSIKFAKITFPFHNCVNRPKVNGRGRDEGNAKREKHLGWRTKSDDQLWFHIIARSNWQQAFQSGNLHNFCIISNYFCQIIIIFDTKHKFYVDISENVFSLLTLRHDV